jgi:hypothetical protein
LRREPDRGVRRAEAGIIAPLDDLEKEAVGDGVRIDLEEFPRRISVVKDAVSA